MTTVQTKTISEVVPVVGDGLDLARALLHSGDYEACITECRSARKSAPGPVKQMAASLLEATARFYQGHYGESLKALDAASGLVDRVAPIQKAKFFAQRAATLRKRNDKKKSDKDAALIDYEAARFWAEDANHELTLASIKNNLAKMYSEAGRFDEAIAESDGAIETAERLDDNVCLGIFCDQRAQVLIDQRQYSEALNFSEKAMRLLAGHPSESEARETHGKALIGLGSCYLETSDPLESLRSRRAAVRIIESSPDDKAISLALERTGGRVRQAAKLLGMQHSALIKIVQQKGLARTPKRQRGKTLFPPIK